MNTRSSQQVPCDDSRPAIPTDARSRWASSPVIVKDHRSITAQR